MVQLFGHLLLEVMDRVDLAIGYRTRFLSNCLQASQENFEVCVCVCVCVCVGEGGVVMGEGWGKEIIKGSCLHAYCNCIHKQ